MPAYEVFNALFAIDPEITKLLPENSDTTLVEGNPTARRYADRIAQWQRAYEILKGKYQKDK